MKSLSAPLQAMHRHASICTSFMWPAKHKPYPVQCNATIIYVASKTQTSPLPNQQAIAVSCSTYARELILQYTHLQHWAIQLLEVVIAALHDAIHFLAVFSEAHAHVTHVRQGSDALE